MRATCRERFLSTQPFAFAVIDVVGDYFGVSPDKIRGRRRIRSITRARSVSVYVLRHATTLSWPEIAAVLGGFDHSSMIAAEHRVKKAIASDERLKHDLMQIALLLVERTRPLALPQREQLSLEPPTGFEPAASPIPTERSAS